MRIEQKNIDAALGQIDRERLRLRIEFDLAMKKLDADERDLLGLKPETEPTGKQSN